MGDRARWPWIEANLDRLYGFAYALTQDHDQSRDLVQECALRAIGASRQPSDEPAYRAWLFRILRNAFIDRCRRNGKEVPLDPEGGFVSDDEGGWAGDRRLIDIVTVRIAIDRLTAAHREVIALIDFVGLSYAEAASVLGVAEGTVMSRVSRARKSLLDLVTEDNVTPLGRLRENR